MVVIETQITNEWNVNAVNPGLMHLSNEIKLILSMVLTDSSTPAFTCCYNGGFFVGVYINFINLFGRTLNYCIMVNCIAGVYVKHNFYIQEDSVWCF